MVLLPDMKWPHIFTPVSKSNVTRLFIYLIYKYTFRFPLISNEANLLEKQEDSYEKTISQ